MRSKKELMPNKHINIFKIDYIKKRVRIIQENYY